MAKKKEKKLTAAELNKMDMNHLEKKLRASEMKECDYKTRILGLEAELNLLKVKLEKRTLADKDAGLNNKHREFVETIKKKHKIDGAFGFNPDTGEITE